MPALHAAPRPLPEAPVLARLAGVRHRYGAVTDLDGLDLSLRSGEVLALLGPNGAGKSTVIGLLTGLLRVQAGRVELCGGDPRDPARRQGLGAMLQEAQLPETLTVRELLQQASAAYAMPRPEAETLALAGLEALARRRYGALSGGQQRRVQFALAICGRPQVVLVDEPTTGLDAEARRAFWAVLRSLREGRSVAEGTPRQLKVRSGVARLRAVSALDPAEVAGLPGVLEAWREGAVLQVRCRNASALARELLARDAALSGLEIQSASLEESVLGLVAGAAAAQHAEAAA